MSCQMTRRKCRCCRKLFYPDYRNGDRQAYCGAEACRRASKAASQRAWRRTPTGRDYFRGETEVGRVQQWRRRNPGYWKKQKSRVTESQPTEPQAVNPEQRSCNAKHSDLPALQDLCLTQHPAFVGLISLVTGATLQEDIANTARSLLLQGQNILGLKIPGATNNHNTHEETPDPTRAPSSGPQRL